MIEVLRAVRNSRRLALLLGASLLLAPRISARGVEDTQAILPRWSWATTPEHLEIARALRESRRTDSAPAPRLVDRIVRAGSGSLEAQVDILARRRVPEAGPDDPPQLLSDPQRELVLTALAQMPETAVRAALRARLDRDPADVGARLAAIHALGVIGNAADLGRLVELAPRAPGKERGEEKWLLPDAREAMRSACAGILRRDPTAWTALVDLLRQTDPDAGRPLLEALSSTKDPRALEVLYAAARAHRELRPQVAALVPVCGSSMNAALDRDVAGWMLSELPSARPEYARMLLQGIGVLDDGTCVAALIEHLEDVDAGVRDSALWALRRVSGLGFSADLPAWNAWNRDEVAWHARERPRLREDLASGDRQRIAIALRAYGEHRTKRAELADDVVKILSNPRPELRRMACEVLQTLGAPSASGALAESLQDPDRDVAEAAWQALKSLTGLDLPRDPMRVRQMLRIS
jgi:HEAT repeat protein